MTLARQTALHCAIYTRKSSEEGLQQSFNSLEAQREACEAFVLSQKEEGWRFLPYRYDDGGYSGGTLDRPSLQRLLADVERGLVNVIVVYKVDRLTRSLSDFARIVETLDAKGVSFVSVTQQFNTTTSMGRLTLNVLLSFAQFEREVTGERIRDKIAASKRKGMWMGGWVPLGYSLEARKLLVEPKEAAVVRKIFSLYHELGCVSKLAVRLEVEEMRSKAWLTKSGTRLGGKPFSRGALYELLQNRLYLGEIRHREQWFAGEHQPIVSRELWEKVQGQIKSNRRERRSHIREQSSSLLTGLLFDARGNRYTPSFTIRRGRRYRYYVSQLAIKSPGRDQDGLIRLPALEIENMVTERLLVFLRSDAEVFDGLSVDGEKPSEKARRVAGAKKLATKWPTLVLRERKELLESFIEQVIIQGHKIELRINKTNLRRALRADNFPSADPERDRTSAKADHPLCLLIDTKLKQSGAELHLVVPPNPSAQTSRQPNPALVKAIASARGWYAQVLEGKFADQTSLARSAGKTERYITRVFRCAFLAPDIVEAILEGRQPRDLTFQELSRDIPANWVEQRKKLGFPAPLLSQS